MLKTQIMFLTVRGGSNEYPQSMFWSKNKKNGYTPAYPSFFCIKVWFKGVYIAQSCFPDVGFCFRLRRWRWRMGLYVQHGQMSIRGASVRWRWLRIRGFQMLSRGIYGRELRDWRHWFVLRIWHGCPNCHSSPFLTCSITKTRDIFLIFARTLIVGTL